MEEGCREEWRMAGKGGVEGGEGGKMQEESERRRWVEGREVEERKS